MGYRIHVGDVSISLQSEYIISRPYQHRLVLKQDQFHAADVEAVVQGNAELALFAEGICVVLLCRFADRDWFLVPVPWFPSYDAVTAAGERGGEVSARLVVTLVQADVVRALRVIEVPERFANAFRRVMLELEEATWPGLADYLALAWALIGRPDALARMLRQARSRVVDLGSLDASPLRSVLMETVED